jgi:hypothetical protein
MAVNRDGKLVALEMDDFIRTRSGDGSQSTVSELSRDLTVLQLGAVNGIATYAKRHEAYCVPYGKLTHGIIVLMVGPAHSPAGD